MVGTGGRICLYGGLGREAVVGKSGELEFLGFEVFFGEPICGLLIYCNLL